MDPRQLLDFLRQHRLAVESSVSVADCPQAAVVGFAVTDELEIIFDTLQSTRKAQNVRRNSQVALVIGGWNAGDERTVQFEGIADEPSGAELERLKSIRAAYPDGPSRLSSPGLICLRVRPDVDPLQQLQRRSAGDSGALRRAIGGTEAPVRDRETPQLQRTVIPAAVVRGARDVALGESYMLTAGMVALRISLVTGSLLIWSFAQAADLLTSLDRIDGGRSLGCDYERVSEMYLFTCEDVYGEFSLQCFVDIDWPRLHIPGTYRALRRHLSRAV